MEIIERVSHPSSAQVEALVQFLEERPSLAKGFLRSAGTKAKAVKEWETLTIKLNSIGGGAIKPAKKWIKLLPFLVLVRQKSAVKKKHSARAAAMRRTGGGLEEVPDLSEIEERIVALMGGGGFATGDAHLRIQVFDEPTPDLSDSPSILVAQSGPILQPGPSCSNYDIPASSFEVYVENAALELGQLGSGNEHVQINQPLPLHEVIEQRHDNQREGTPLPAAPEVVAETAGHNVNRSAPSTPRRRRIRAVKRSPPSQRRSQFVSITEKFLLLEQQRLALERRVVAIMEQNNDVNRLVAQANITLGEGLKALAEVIKKNT